MAKSSHLRRSFIGARIEFNGNIEDEQNAVFANGRMFRERDLHFVIRNVFTWSVDLEFEFKNDIGFVRTPKQTFKTSPCRFNELTDYVYELTTKEGLNMPSGYKFVKNRWRARIVA